MATIKIFVLHCPSLVERKNHILEQFAKQGIIEFEFIECYNKDEISDKENLFISGYKKEKMSLFLKHIHVYNEIIQKYDYALIFEDDVIIRDNFMEKLYLYISQLPNDFDMLFVGDVLNLHIPNNLIKPDQYVYQKTIHPTHWGGDGISKCTDSYIVSKKCAIELIDYYKHIIEVPIDLWLNIVGRNKKFNVYWGEPTLCKQGTHTGLFKTSL
jgi:glycosyl transferase family 25